MRSICSSEIDTLLPAPNPRLLTYPKETVVAEKFEAMVKLGIANSRMKDFYDLEALSRNLDFDGKMLGQAIRKTFERRGTELPAGGTAVAFTPEFYNDTDKKKQWTAFGTRNATALKCYAVATTRRCPWRRDRGTRFTVISTSRPSRVKKCMRRSVEKPESWPRKSREILG